jgi:leucyl-tRNA synthetase
MEFVNYLSSLDINKDVNELFMGYTRLLIILSPFVPHFSEYLYESLTNQNLNKKKWPEVDKKSLKTKKQIIVVQVNGKVRDNIECDSDESQSSIEEKVFLSEKVLKFIGDKKMIKKIIFIKNKILNIVI